MTDGLKSYPATKDPGVPWLGTVPTHWERKRLKSLLRQIDRRSSTGTETLLSLRREHGIVVYSEHFSRPSQGATTVGYKIVNKGQLVVNRLQANNGLVFDSSLDGVVSPDYSVFEPRAQIVMPYLSLLLRTATYRDHFRRESTGLGTGSAGFLRLYDDRLLETPVVLPPIGEQIAILRFLDHADRRIRRYIRAKQKLITLLEEQKQGIIHRAVTRGLNPSVGLQPSGVEWLGDVPKHWEVRRLKSIVKRVDQGVSPQAENYLADGATWGVLKAGCVNRGVFREKEHKRLPASFKYDPSLAVTPGDVLVSRASGSPDLVGSVGRVSSLMYKLILSDKTFRPVFTSVVEPDFIVLAMNSRYYREQVQQAISGAEGLANNLPLSSLRAFYFVIPPRQEQQDIVDSLLPAVAEASATIARIEREIVLLREYRIRLIADVVTGQLDVREAAARLPSEVLESDSRDEAETEDAVEESPNDAVVAEAEA